MNEKIWTAALAVCLCALLLLSACGSKEGTETVSGGEAETKTLTLAASGESDVLASIYMGTDNMPTIKLVYDTLVKYENGEFVPGLAESWEFSDDGKTLTFQLRAGVKFHDGTACDVEAVKANLEYKQNNPGFMALKAITAIQSIEVVDETTLIIHYPAPYYAYLADFCWPDVMIIVSPTVFIEGDYMNFSGISGTGPYAFDHRESGQYTRFVRNEDYWGDAPYYDEIIVKYIPESTSRIQALQNGEIDMIFGSALLSYDEYVQVTAMDGMAGQISESDTRVRDLVVNASRPLLTDLKVRQAIAYAIDKESLSENLTYGHEKAAELPFTEGSPYMDIVLEQTYSYDQEQSNLLLDEAGWVMNDSTGIREKDGQSLSLVLTLDSAYGSFDHSVATVIKDQLKKGIKRPGKGKQQPATKWNSSTVTKILSLQEYCGDILNFKTYSKSYKNKRGWRMTVKIGSSSRTSTSRLSSGPYLSRCSRSGEKSASVAPTKASTTCSLVCWSVPTAAAIFTSTSIRETRRSSISTAPTIRATVGAVLPPTMSEWIFWNRLCLARYGA